MNMENSMYMEKIREHISVGDEATRTTHLKACAAYLYGDAAIYQYECALCGDDVGQDIAIKLEEACKKVIDASIIDVVGEFQDVKAKVQVLMDHLS